MIRAIRAIQVIAVGAALAAAVACSKEAAPEATAAAAAGKPPVAVAVGPVVVADLEESVEVVGSLAPKFAADVKSEVSGIVTAVYVTEWVSVRKGERLARLDTSETEAGIEALKAVEAQARVGETRARREYERAQQLEAVRPDHAAGARRREVGGRSGRGGAAAARAQIKAAQARLAKSTIVAPMDGVVAFAASASATASRTWAATLRCSASSTTGCSI